jgi:predicted TIM-barrel fold metal-dependent hydrolase
MSHMLEKKTVRRHLDIVRNLKNSHEFYDTHVHPFEVFSDQFEYHASQEYEGLFTTGSARFTSPKLTSLSLGEQMDEKEKPDIQLRIELLLIRSLYVHTGPKLFSDHMMLSGIDKVLLLPVAPSSGGINSQMSAMAKMFGNDSRFLMGCSIPNSIENSQINKFVKQMVNQFDIKAIKLHPNITGIDMSASTGKERVENILCACNESRLPVIVHGGRSPILRNPAAAYSCIDNLERIDWGMTGQTVVIAHAGSYSCNLREIEHEVLPRLKKLLSLHNNLMVDISALKIDAMIAVLRNIDSDRILFGSDALYESQWSSIVKLLHVLSKTTSRIEGTFIKIASLNPSRHIFKHALEYAYAN